MYIKKEITDDMTMETIHQLREEFKAVEFPKFKTNFCRSKNRIDKDWERAKADADGYSRDMSLPNHILARDIEEEWHGSKAQAMLRKIMEGGDDNSVDGGDGGYLDGDNDDDEEKDQDEEPDHENSCNDDIFDESDDEDDEDSEEEDLEYDGSGGDGSPEVYLTTEEIDRYRAMKPSELYASVEEFQKFDYNPTFRKQFHQERRRKIDSGYWLVKKTKKEKRKQAKLRGETYKDDDNDFYDPVLDFDTLSNW